MVLGGTLDGRCVAGGWVFRYPARVLLTGDDLFKRVIDPRRQPTSGESSILHVPQGSRHTGVDCRYSGGRYGRLLGTAPTKAFLS